MARQTGSEFLRRTGLHFVLPAAALGGLALLLWPSIQRALAPNAMRPPAPTPNPQITLPGSTILPGTRSDRIYPSPTERDYVAATAGFLSPYQQQHASRRFLKAQGRRLRAQQAFAGVATGARGGCGCR